MPSSPPSASATAWKGTGARLIRPRSAWKKLRSFLQKNAAPDLHHKTFLLWASLRLDGLMTAEQRTRTVQQLKDLQRPDGGWNLPSLGDWKRHDGTPNDKDAGSDGYATGLVVYVLRKAGVNADDPAIVRAAVGWLKKNQPRVGPLVYSIAQHRHAPLHHERGDGLRRHGLLKASRARRTVIAL